MVEPIAFQDMGEGPPLVLVHGGYSDGRSTWGAQMRALTGRHRLIVVDRRGHGASPREPRPYTFASDAADILDAADRAGVTLFHLVGHSYGGLVAIEVARQAPERIRSLHVIEPPYLALMPADPDVRGLIERGQEIARGAGQLDPERIAAAFFELVLGPAELAELRGHPAWAHLVREAARSADEEFPAEYPATALDGLRLAVPVRVYTGGRSHPGLRRLARHLAERLPGARLVDVPEATHVVQRAAGPFHEALLAVTASSADGRPVG